MRRCRLLLSGVSPFRAVVRLVAHMISLSLIDFFGVLLPTLRNNEARSLWLRMEWAAQYQVRCLPSRRRRDFALRLYLISRRHVLDRRPVEILHHFHSLEDAGQWDAFYHEMYGRIHSTAATASSLHAPPPTHATTTSSTQTAVDHQAPNNEPLSQTDSKRTPHEIYEDNKLVASRGAGKEVGRRRVPRDPRGVTFAADEEHVPSDPPTGQSPLHETSDLRKSLDLPDVAGSNKSVDTMNDGGMATEQGGIQAGAAVVATGVAAIATGTGMALAPKKFHLNCLNDSCNNNNVFSNNNDSSSDDGEKEDNSK